jgi:hypothetical protein
MSTRLYQHIETLWDYMQMHQHFQKADCIFCMCSNDERVAEYAAQVYLDGIAPKLIFSGAQGRLTEGLFDVYPSNLKMLGSARINWLFRQDTDLKV